MACNRSDLTLLQNIRSSNELRDRFRPEFLNRVDELVSFEALSREQLADIVKLQLARLRERLAERRIELEVTDEAKELLAEEGWDPGCGARNAQRCRSEGREPRCRDCRRPARAKPTESDRAFWLERFSAEECAAMGQALFG